ncbi:zinc finger matrin-type protein 5 isoform X2 [Syngnathus typhle]|uniref:zinc finger matrin-type protein 5 isoform X2 n=1 Tax=Syngnathus typhle TaxID=161592 RepID=UPI002A6B138B|nr:zinc finger matrin-type protein 5 isoform X2 [Syngnathus typhle]
MGKRYYCDYCERSFQDNMHNRKKHLFGVQHQRAKKAWFDHFRSYADIWKDEQAKKPCRKFLQRDERRRSEGWEDPSEARPSVAAWLTTREKRRSGRASKGVEEQQEEERTQGDLPPQIFSIPDLPPSLVPPPPGGWKAEGSAQWG